MHAQLRYRWALGSHNRFIPSLPGRKIAEGERKGQGGGGGDIKDETQVSGSFTAHCDEGNKAEEMHRRDNVVSVYLERINRIAFCM